LAARRELSRRDRRHSHSTVDAMTKMTPKEREKLEMIARRCLDLAHGEPGYAVALIYDRMSDEMARRRAVNLLFRALQIPAKKAS
jgi:hypothetical protein